MVELIIMGELLSSLFEPKSLLNPSHSVGFKGLTGNANNAVQSRRPYLLDTYVTIQPWVFWGWTNGSAN